jgi:hypothetical protein
VSESFLEAEVEIYSFNLPSPGGTVQRYGQHPRFAQPIWKLRFMKKSYCTQRDLRKFFCHLKTIAHARAPEFLFRSVPA